MPPNNCKRNYDSIVDFRNEVASKMSDIGYYNKALDVNNLVNMGEQFSGLDMNELIGEPLKATYNAQSMLASSTVQFIKNDDEVELDDAGGRKAKTATFGFTREPISPDETEQETSE